MGRAPLAVRQWSGFEARALREAMRLTVRGFAGRLGISERTVSKWEAGGSGITPGPDSQSLLDTALSMAGDEVRERFSLATAARPPVHALRTGSLVVDSHKFIPTYLGTDRAREIVSDVRFERHQVDWLDAHRATIGHDDGHCDLYVFPCGVSVGHLRQRREFASITDLAVWRYRSYIDDLPWLAERINDLLPAGATTPLNPDYVLSLYGLEAGPWTGDDLDTALRLMCVPSVLVDRSSPDGPRALEADVERSLLVDQFTHPDVVPFGVQGVSLGYAGWSGVAYHVLSADRALQVGELVDLELAVQMLWCYCHRIQSKVEDGVDPSVPDAYGWRYLRAAYSRLTAARAQETSQHCLMREAIVATSGLAQRLRAAQEALRDSDRTREVAQ